MVMNENNLEVPDSKIEASKSQFSKIKTAEGVIENIMSVVPSPLQVESEKSFLQESYQLTLLCW